MYICVCCLSISIIICSREPLRCILLGILEVTSFIRSNRGEGPKLVKELSRVAKENSPSIIFIDEIDAIGTKRRETKSGGGKEIQFTMLMLN